GTWIGWLTDTLQTATTFMGTAGYSYTFQIRATDNAGNVTNPWVQTTNPIKIEQVTKYYFLGSNRLAMRQGSMVYYLHGHHLGSVSLTTNASGGLVAQSRYLPFGEERWSSGAAPTDFGFTSQREESGFGLVDYNARYYSAGLGRFISPDTVVPEPGNPQAWN